MANISLTYWLLKYLTQSAIEDFEVVKGVVVVGEDGSGRKCLHLQYNFFPGGATWQ
jgi:hypothetical protein